MLRNQMKEFLEFIREKGVLGLALGIIIGGAVSRLVTAIVADLVSPIIGVVTGAGSGLATFAYTIPFTQITFKWGDLLSNLIEFLSVLTVVYLIFVKTPIIRNMDKKKEDK